MISEYDKQSQLLQYRDLRDRFVGALSAQDRALAFSRIPSPLTEHIQPGKIVAGYVAIGSEVDPSALLAQAHALGS